MLLSVPSDNIRWKCPRSSDFVLRDWSDGSVLFDDANGQLQFLNPASGMLMRMFLERADWSATELAAALLETTPSEEDCHLVNEMLAQFHALKLIERSTA